MGGKWRFSDPVAQCVFDDAGLTAIDLAVSGWAQT
jgi:hypothetical protein